MSAGIQIHLDDLMVQGPLQVCFLDPTKSILVVSPQNIPRAEDLFQGCGLQIVTGNGYLRGGVRMVEAQAWWLEDKF